MIFGGRKQNFWSCSFLNWQGQRFYFEWSLTLKTKSCFLIICNNICVRCILFYYSVKYQCATERLDLLFVFLWLIGVGSGFCQAQTSLLLYTQSNLVEISLDVSVRQPEGVIFFTTYSGLVFLIKIFMWGNW